MFQAQVIYSMKMPWGIEWSSNKVIAFCSMLFVFVVFFVFFCCCFQWHDSIVPNSMTVLTGPIELFTIIMPGLYNNQGVHT